ncbi:MAG: hypothetical protein QME59_01810 [Candidatus Hydrothermarchaeota archaeon]|nr:hypothetical protein [Candidatus Hydrothermarchaeota archaeon]
MEVKLALGAGIVVILFTMYYLEKQMEREQIFWLFAGLGIVFGIVSVYTVAKDILTYDYYITFSVLFVLIAILYYPEAEAKKEKKKESK